MRASRLPFNKRVYMPPYADETTEARITHARKEIETLVDHHITSNNNKSWPNLTKQQYNVMVLNDYANEPKGRNRELHNRQIERNVH